MWFQIASSPFCGMGNGMPLMASSTPLPPSARLAFGAISIVLS